MAQTTESIKWILYSLHHHIKLREYKQHTRVSLSLGNSS